MAAEKKDPVKVKKFWNKMATTDGIASEQVTHKDIWQRWLEIQMITKLLGKKDSVIDIGCGNGFSTRIFSNFCKNIIGVDYSEAMINRAREESRKAAQALSKPPSFSQCNVLELTPSLFGTFDVAISERCLINLSNFKEQKKAIANIASVIKPNGKFIFVEGSADGRKMLNKLRRRVGLSVMQRVWHNVDFNEIETLKYLKKFFVVEDQKHFGIYDFLSRVVHPLMVTPEDPKYAARINEVAAQLSVMMHDFDYLSRVLFLVLRKK